MPDDAAQIASELTGLLQAGASDPLALLAGTWRFHACFLAPFSPSFAAARQQFLVDGGGPLSATVEQLCSQGMTTGEALATARRLIESANGLCVAVVAGDHGVMPIAQPFLGTLSPEWRQGAAQVLAEPYRGHFATALAGLESRADRGWPHIVAGPALKDDDLAAFWLELTHGTADAVDLAAGRSDARLADLCHWVCEAVRMLVPADDLDADDHAALARCHLAAMAYEEATTAIAACAAAGGDGEAVDLLDLLATTVARNGGDTGVAGWLGSAAAADTGPAYDVALARVRVLAAGGVDAAALRPAVAALLAADRKLARQALTREPIWQVTAADPGELIDTAAAAELLGRSPTAIAKRLETRTMPLHAADGQVRIPRRALEAWRAALGEHGLLDS